MTVPPLSLYPLPSLISSHLNQPFGTQGRSWVLIGAYCLQSRNGHKRAFVPRSPIAYCLVSVPLHQGRCSGSLKPHVPLTMEVPAQDLSRCQELEHQTGRVGSPSPSVGCMHSVWVWADQGRRQQAPQANLSMWYTMQWFPLHRSSPSALSTLQFSQCSFHFPEPLVKVFV